MLVRHVQRRTLVVHAVLDSREAVGSVVDPGATMLLGRWPGLRPALPKQTTRSRIKVVYIRTGHVKAKEHALPMACVLDKHAKNQCNVRARILMRQDANRRRKKQAQACFAQRGTEGTRSSAKAMTKQSAAAFGDFRCQSTIHASARDAASSSGIQTGILIDPRGDPDRDPKVFTNTPPR